MKPTGTEIEVAHHRIRPDPNQPRQHFDGAALNSLAMSIAAVGQIQPVLLKPVKSRDHDYELIDGERRWRACALIHKRTLRAIVRTYSTREDQDVAAVVSNFAREGHTVMETARAIRKLRAHPSVANLTTRAAKTEALAKIFGRSPAWVYQHEAILTLIPELLDYLDPKHGDQALAASTAIEMTHLTPDQQHQLYQRYQGRPPQLRQVRAFAAQLKGKAPTNWTKHSGWTGPSNAVPLNAALTAVTEALEHDLLKGEHQFALDRLLRAINSWKERRQEQRAS